MSVVNLDAALRDALQGRYDGFKARVEEIDYEWKEDGMEVAGRFFYLAFRDGEPTVDEFVDFVHGQIIPFCIPRRVRDEKRRRFVEEENYRYWNELVDQARTLFIRAKESRKTAGEIGELILFTLLEAAMGAPQLVCKMALKTSEAMPVHGSDSIHATVGSQPGRLCLLWGESKVYQQFSSALDEACESMRDFLAVKDGRTAQHRDIDVLRDHFSASTDPAVKEALLEYLDPYSPQYNEREDAFACFVGFDYAAFKKVRDKPKAEVREFFRREYHERVMSGCTLFGGKLRDSGLSRHRVHFLLLPFPDVDELRTKFFAKLGVAA
jgi:hypothetical protein